MDDRLERIRRRAHEIWEHEGKQHGLHQEHWHRAAREIDEEDSRSSETPDQDTGLPASESSVAVEQVTGAGPAIAEHSKDAAPKPRATKPKPSIG